MKTECREQLRHTSKNIGMTVHEGLSLLQTELESISYVHENTAFFGEKTFRRPSFTHEDQRFLGVTSFGDRNTHRALFGEPCPKPVLTAAIRAHLTSDKTLLFTTTRTAGGFRMFMCRAIKQNSSHGLLVAEIRPDYLWSLIIATLPPRTEVTLLDQNGSLLFSSLSPAPDMITQLKTGLKGTSIGQFDWSDKGSAFLANYWTIFLKPVYMADTWTVVVSQPRADILLPVKGFIRTFTLIIALTILVVIYISSIQIRRNLVPLTLLQQGAKRISQGDLECTVTIASGDEFEELATTFNSMVVSLGQQFSKLNEMGFMVRRIVAAQDKTTIIRVVLTSLPNAVPCHSLALTLINPGIRQGSLTWHHCSSEEFQEESKPQPSNFTDDELASLDLISEHLHCHGTGSFTSLLLPLMEKGANEFYLLPFFLKGCLTGILTIGYTHRSSDLRGDLPRARQIAEEIGIALDNLRLIEELNQFSWGTINTLANAVDAKSPWTSGHSVRVTHLAVMIGKAMGLPENELKILNLGGILHDIGKIGVPGAILNKAEQLTDDEFAVIKTHPDKGAKILKPIAVYEAILPLVSQHHEWFNGQGYPRGLSGENISLGARIIAVADVFDGLISDRPYREGWELSEVIAYLVDSSGTQFDPEIVRVFLAQELATAVKDINLREDFYPLAHTFKGLDS